MAREFGNGAQARNARAPQRVLQRMNMTPQPAPRFATMHGSHAVPVGVWGLRVTHDSPKDLPSGTGSHFAPPTRRGPSERRPLSAARSTRAPHRLGATCLSKWGFTRGPRLPRPVRDRHSGRHPIRSGACFDGSKRRCLTLRANTASRRQAFGGAAIRLRRRLRNRPGRHAGLTIYRWVNIMGAVGHVGRGPTGAAAWVVAHQEHMENGLASCQYILCPCLHFSDAVAVAAHGRFHLNVRSV